MIQLHATSAAHISQVLYGHMHLRSAAQLQGKCNRNKFYLTKNFGFFNNICNPSILDLFFYKITKHKVKTIYNFLN